MALTNKKQTTSNLKLGSSWSSFEKFRTEGARGLEHIKNGTVATLQTKTGHYRILSESDFQTMYGLARDVDRLRGGLRVVLSAARAVQKHQDSDTIEVLLESVKLLGSLPELPTRQEFEALIPEGFDLEDLDDEVTIEPNQINRPLDTQEG